jgi:hypothetical protein
MHWIYTLRKLRVRQEKGSALKHASKHASTGRHSSRPVKVPLQMSVQGYVLDLRNEDQFLIAHATCT